MQYYIFDYRSLVKPLLSHTISSPLSKTLAFLRWDPREECGRGPKAEGGEKKIRRNTLRLTKRE
jgi:hypothetical protein